MRIAVISLLLSGCTTTSDKLAVKQPFEVVHSQQPRSAVVDCLLNRLTSDDLLPTRQVGATATTVAFNGHGLAANPAIYNFVIRDAPMGSVIEVRRFAKSNLAAAETCF